MQAARCAQGRAPEAHWDDAVAGCVVDGDARAAPGQRGHPGGLGEDSRTNLRSAPAMTVRAAASEDATLETAPDKQTPY